METATDALLEKYDNASGYITGEEKIIIRVKKKKKKLFIFLQLHNDATERWTVERNTYFLL